LDKHRELESIVLFVADVDEAANWYSSLLNAPVSKVRDNFRELPHEPFTLGVHPADNKSAQGTAVSYWRVDSVSESVQKAASYGFSIYRGPLRLEKITVAQIRDEAGMVIGLLERHVNPDEQAGR
jgi:predicted enzyme related to lactoylglutathione lyase